MNEHTYRHTKGYKADADKVRMELFPLEVVEAISEVLTFGAKKYTEEGWKEVPKAKQRYLGALLRHLTAIQKGEEFDDESGLPHLYHAGCNIVFLIHFYLEEKDGELSRKHSETI